MKYGSYMPLVSWDFSYEWIHSFYFSDWWRCEGANTRFMKPTHCVRILLGVLSVQFYLMAVALWGTCCPHIIDDEVETQSESYCISKPAPSLESKHPLLLPNLCIFPFLTPGRCQCEGQTVLCRAATSQLFFSHACSMSSLTSHSPSHSGKVTHDSIQYIPISILLGLWG